MSQPFVLRAVVGGPIGFVVIVQRLPAGEFAFAFADVAGAHRSVDREIRAEVLIARSGRFGGQVVGKGTPKEFEAGKIEGSLTGDYLSSKKVIPIPKSRRMERKSDATPNHPESRVPKKRANRQSHP